MFFVFIFFSNNKLLEKMSSMADLIINKSQSKDILYENNSQLNNNNLQSFDDLYKKLIYYQVTPYSIPSKKNTINDNKNTIYDKDIKYYNLNAMFDRYNLHLDDKHINLYV
jgi:hypothetical protein